MGFWKCFFYLTALGILSHFVGLLLSHHRFHADRIPWRPAAFERDGRFWDRTLHVRRWMNVVPDMSRICPDMVPKRIEGVANVESIERLIRETCVAELIHWALALLGFFCVSIWNGMGGWTLSLIYGVGNIPFVIIQRYNRPRLVRLHGWLAAKEQSVAPVVGQETEVSQV